MSRGKNAARRGQRTLAWYLGDKLLDRPDESQSPIPRKNSIESESSLNSQKVWKQPNGTEEPKKRKNRNRPKRSNHPNPSKPKPLQELGNGPSDIESSGGSRPCSLELTAPDSLAALSAAQKTDRENYCYYDQTSDGFYYEKDGSRGWRKRNPKIHGQPPIATKPETNSRPVEKKPFAFQSNIQKPFPQTAQNVNKYYDAASDGYFFEMASVDGWRRRQPSNTDTFPPLGREPTSAEVEDFVISKIPKAPKMDEYPSSSSTVSSSVSDDVTPPPKKETVVGSFEEPYEFYWSDNEKTTEVPTNIVDPLNVYFERMGVEALPQFPIKRPNTVNRSAESRPKTLQCFNVDKFIADLPGMLDHDGSPMPSLYTPLALDSPRTFSQFISTKETKDSWENYGFRRPDDSASADLERGLRDLEKIWQSGC